MLMLPSLKTAPIFVALLAIASTVAADATVDHHHNVPSTTLHIFVDPIGGSDSKSGTTPTDAFRTVHRAADELTRAAKSNNNKRRVVQLFPGEHWLNETLLLDVRHSNTLWRSYDPKVVPPTTFERGGILEESEKSQAHIRGGYKVASSLFRPWHKYPLIHYARIPLEVGGLGRITSGNLQQCANSKAEVYFDGQPMVLARHPNIGTGGRWQWQTIVNVTANDTFTFAGNRPIKRGYASEQDHLWLHGYWKFDWADNYVKVKSVNATARSYTIDTKESPILYELTVGARYYVVNLLQELDSPGEYYIDRRRRLLFLIPPEEMTTESEVVISTVNNLVKADGLADTSFRNIAFSTSRGTGLGFYRASGIHIDGGRIENIGGPEAIRLWNSSDSSIRGMSIQNCMCAGIAIGGGDRKRLVPSGIEVSHNVIAHYGNWKRTYMPGILFSGCGHIVLGNVISDAPQEGITGKCNDCVFDSNHFKDLCYEGVDAGAFYAGRSWAERGNVVKNNLFERIRRTENATHGYGHVQAIYLDDQMSGYTVANNTVVDSDTGILLGGGRDNLLIGNKFIRTDVPLSFDDRGLTWDGDNCQEGNKFEAELLSYDYKNPPWSLRYPELLNIFHDRPCTPTHNKVGDFAFCGIPDGKTWIETPGTGIDQLLTWGNDFSNVSQVDSMCHDSFHPDFSSRVIAVVE